MITLFSTLISFLTGGLPKLLDFFQDKSDKKHELQLAQMQLDQQFRSQAAGFQAQERIEEIHTQHLQIEADVQERQALYAHDIEIGKGASQWVINMRAMVRPAITFGLFSIFLFVELFGFYYAIHTDVEFATALDILWNEETRIVWASIIGFYFGTRR